MKKPMATRIKRELNPLVNFTLLVIVFCCIGLAGSIEYNDLIKPEKVAKR